jgi:PAS domain S-box-containing protein
VPGCERGGAASRRSCLLDLVAARLAEAQDAAAARAERERYERWFRTLDQQLQVLDRERQKFAAFAQQAGTYVFVVDADGVIRWTNKTLAATLPAGAGPEEGWLGRRCIDACTRFGDAGGCGSGAEACPVTRALGERHPTHCELRGAVDGDSRAYYLTALPIQAPDGRAHEAVVQIQDLSDLDVLRRSEARQRSLLAERARTEEALRHAEERLRTVIANAPIVLFAIDRDGRFTLSQGKGLEALGLAPGEFEGRSAFEVYADNATIVDNLHRALGGEEFTARVEVGPLCFETRYAPVRDAAGGVTGVIGVAMNVTEQRRLEEQLRHSQKMEAIGYLAGGVAHDFNNLLTVILGHSEMLLARAALGETAGAALARSASEIHEAGRRGAWLARQLLAFCRKDVPACAPLNLDQAVGDLDGMLRRLIGEDVELCVRPAARPVWIEADRGHVEQVILNLVLNAREAMPLGGSLAIEVDEIPGAAAPGSPALGWVRLVVRDSGCGMDEETLAHLFEPFFTTKERGKGTGLGLSIVYGIVKQAGGEVRIESRRGQGTVVTIDWPRVEAGGPCDLGAGLGAGARGAETVLLAEDEDEVRDLVRDMLEMSGYRVLLGASGAEALAVADAHGGSIDLLVTDVVMPRMSGGELAGRLQSQRPEVRVLFMSGYPDDAVVRHGVLDAGAAFLPKPFSFDDLTRKVREVLDAPHAAAA